MMLTQTTPNPSTTIIRHFAGIATATHGVPILAVERQIDLFNRANPSYGADVCAALVDLHLLL